MLTPVHLLFNFGIYTFVDKTHIIKDVNGVDLWWLFSAELIDLDHLFSRPIYQKLRNSFKVNILHKNWKWLSIISFILLFFRPVMFLGIGILSHFLMDYLYNKIYHLDKKEKGGAS